MIFPEGALRAEFALLLGLALTAPAWSQSGYQEINGTRVFTRIDQARGVATFSNSCGSQTLTQRELQAGAIPREIIPCPRPGSSTAEKARSNCQLGLRTFYALGFPENLPMWRDACVRAGMADEYARAVAQGAIKQKEAIAAEAKKANELADYPRKCADAKAALEETLWPAYLDGIKHGRDVTSIYTKKVEAENLIYYTSGIGDGTVCSEARMWYKQAKADFEKKEEQAWVLAPRQATAPDASTLRAQQGTCSDITGVGGGPGPSNCTKTAFMPANLQSQFSQTRANSRVANPSNADLQGAARQFRQIEATLRQIGDLADAERAAEEAITIERVLAGSPSGSVSCPARGPESFWLGTAHSKYCADANCVERGSAYYGMLCWPDYKQKRTYAEQKRICGNLLLTFTRRSLDAHSIAVSMCKGIADLSCDEAGNPLDYRHAVMCRLKWSDEIWK